MSFDSALRNFRATFHAADPAPKDDGLRQIPVSVATALTEGERVHLQSWKRQHQARHGITPTTTPELGSIRLHDLEV